MAAARVLVVDDEPAITRLVVHFLRGEGYEVVPAAGAGEALELITKSRVDVVVSDVVMPEMQGDALIREIKRIAPEIGSVLITGAAGPCLVVPSGTPVLRKPFFKDDLLSAVRSVLAAAQAARRELAAASGASAMVREQSRKLRSETEELRRKVEETMRTSHGLLQRTSENKPRKRDA